MSKFGIVFVFWSCATLLFAQGPLANKPVFTNDSVPLDSQQLIAPLNVVCPSGIAHSKMDNRVEVTCPVCPANSAFPSNSSWRLTSAVFGHFVNASSDDLILFADGCESHQAQFGGLFLLTQENHAWKNRGYYPGVITAWVRKVRMKDGRDLLVSQDEYGMGGYVGPTLSSIVFKGNDFVESDLLQVEDETNEFCTEPGIGPTGGTSVGKLISAKILDLDNDRLVDLSVTAQFGKARFTPIQQKECAAGEQPKIPVHMYTLDFLLQGDKLVIAPWSKEAQQKLNDALRAE